MAKGQMQGLFISQKFSRGSLPLCFLQTMFSHIVLTANMGKDAGSSPKLLPLALAGCTAAPASRDVEGRGRGDGQSWAPRSTFPGGSISLSGLTEQKKQLCAQSCLRSKLRETHGVGAFRLPLSSPGCLDKRQLKTQGWRGTCAWPASLPWPMLFFLPGMPSPPLLTRTTALPHRPCWSQPPTPCERDAPSGWSFLSLRVL